MNVFLRSLLDRREELDKRATQVLADAEARVERARAEAPDEQIPADLTDEERDAFNAIQAELEPIDERIAEFQAAEQRGRTAAEAAGEVEVRVISEPTTYHRGGPRSYFRDLINSRPQADSDDRDGAVERLRRHQRELEVDLGREERANMTRTDGAGGEFVPPLWLMDQYLPLARAGRVTADLCRSLPLPPGTDSINLPKVNTGTGVAAQTEANSVQKTDMTTTSVNAPVRTFAGQQVFSLQLLDQSPLNMDEIVFADLLAAHAVAIDGAVINGSGAPSFTGILGTSGITAVTYTDASPTVPELYPKVADSIQQIGTSRFLPAQAIVMHNRRWAWHTAALDSQNRPLVVPNPQGPANAFAGMGDVRSEGSVGELQGLPVYVDPNVPVNLGGSTNEDRIIIARFDDLFLFEGPLRTRVLFETDADTLQVRLQVWNYAAFLPNRYPASIAVISGTGLATPTF